MSFSIRPLREISESPLEQFANILAKQVSIKFQRDTIDQIQDSDKEDIFARPIQTESVIKWHPELNSTRLFDFSKKYYPAGDGQVTEMWLRGTNLGNKSEDWSVKFGHEKHHATIYGDPVLVDGTIDLGIQTGPEGVKSVARRMNRPRSPFKNKEYMVVPTTEAIQTASVSVGYSTIDRIRVWSTSSQGGHSPTVWVMIDDDGPDSGRMLQIKEDGRIVYIFRQGGNTIAKQTAAGLVNVGAVYEIATRYDPVGAGDISILVDGSLKSLQPFTGNINWPADLTDFDLHLFRRDIDSGHLYADFYDHKEFSDYIITEQQVLNHFINKWTLSAHEFGHVMVTNYWSTFKASSMPTGPCSFSPTSFSPGSFTTCEGGGGTTSGSAYDHNDYDENDYD